jgi:4-azaleucine resistance transporter AzlC
MLRCRIDVPLLSLAAMSSSRRAFTSGLKAVSPILVGVIPFGMIYGVVALDAGLTRVQTQAMSIIVFAGSSQFIMAQLFAEHTPALIIVITAALVNLRHGLYSASMSPYFKSLPGLARWVLAYFLTDEAYAVSIIHFRKGINRETRHWYYLGSGIGLWVTWQLSTAAGIFLGELIPPELPLDFFIALTFIALLVPALDDWASVIAASVAGVAGLLAFALPLGTSLIVASLIGIGAGLIAERWFTEKNLSQEEEVGQES